nr:SDR family NAD(P)-dependent oxidoreductase [uncultured Oscillibacter sp.]
MDRLNGKTAVIAGGSKGIGYAVSVTFAREGASVAVVGSSAEAAERTAGEITAAGGRAISIAADLTEEAGRALVWEKALSAFGQIDILVNNAGWGCKKPLIETDLESFDRSINLNLKASYFMTQLAARQMILQGQGGSIINISSTAALQGERNSSIYAATKAGIIAFSKAAALELGGAGITVNCVLPGFTRTNNNGHVPPSADENFKRITPTGRVTVAQDIANACLFLCTEEARQITAQVLPVDGGYSGTRAMDFVGDASMQRK